MAFNPNMSNREVADLILINYTTRAVFTKLDYANVSTTNLNADRTMVTGGQGAPTRIVFDSKRTGTLKVDTQITPMKLYSMLSGTDILATTKILKREELTSTTKAVTLSTTPIAGSVSLYLATDDAGSPLDITVSGTTVTITETGYTDGNVIAYYFTTVSTGVTSVKFTSKNFPKAYYVYGETPWKTESDEIVSMKLQYFKAVPKSDFEIAFSSTGDAVSLSISFDLLADSDDNIYEMAIVE